MFPFSLRFQQYVLQIVFPFNGFFVWCMFGRHKDMTIQDYTMGNDMFFRMSLRGHMPATCQGRKLHLPGVTHIAQAVQGAMVLAGVNLLMLFYQY